MRSKILILYPNIEKKDIREKKKRKREIEKMSKKKYNIIFYLETIFICRPNFGHI